MNVRVAIEQRFSRLPDGSIWTQTPVAWSFWRRYLDVFGHVHCMARVQDVARLEGQWHRADGEGVSFVALPYYLGPLQFLRLAGQVRQAIRQEIRAADAFILRVPGNIANVTWGELRVSGHPYGVEVVADPYDAFAPGAVQHPTRRFFRWYAPRQLRRQCAGACAASYVTSQVLPDRYPTNSPTTVVSSIELPDDAFVPEPRVFVPTAASRHVVFVGSLEQYYKGPDILIQSLAGCLARGLDVRLTIVGEGKHRHDLEALAGRLQCRERVRFAGHVPAGGRVVTELDKADLFVLPSRSEGLPRAMIEAMARGLPCIGSATGGFPELVDGSYLARPGDVGSLTELISRVVQDPERMSQMSAENLHRARLYRNDLLQARRVEFYRHVLDLTSVWLRRAAA